MGDSGSAQPFRRVTRDRLLVEMLESTKGAGATEWKVLVLDKFTVRVLSSSSRMADLADEGVSLVEDLGKGRQPYPRQDAVYFIQPTRESIQRMIADMGGKTALYRRVFVFLSAPLPKELLQTIKGESALLPRIAALKEVNLEYLTVDMEAFVTDHVDALKVMFGEGPNEAAQVKPMLDSMATRLATVFASLKEFPAVRYRAARAAGENSSGDLIPTKLAAALWDNLSSYRGSLPGFPRDDTCDLLILDRSVDVLTPMVHEWSYRALTHDLLAAEIKDNRITMPDTRGQREVLLDEQDPVWVELRDLYVWEVFDTVRERMAELKSKNKVAALAPGGKQELSMSEMQKITQALPQYQDLVDKLSRHIHIASEINKRIEGESLRAVGAVEQNLAFGKASSKELLELFNSQPTISKEVKIRLLAMYAATHPEKLDSKKRIQWMKLLQLGEEDMAPVNNLELLGVAVSKKAGGSKLSLGFGASKSKGAVRKERRQLPESGYTDFIRYYPLLQDLAEDLVKGELSREEFPYVKEPGSSGSRGRPDSSSGGAAPVSTRTNKSTWAGKGAAAAGGRAGGEGGARGRRLFIFIIGGMLHSEVRAAHKLSTLLRREVIIGSTSLETPHSFLQKLQSLNDTEAMDF